jgi:hypothetical protein
LTQDAEARAKEVELVEDVLTLDPGPDEEIEHSERQIEQTIPSSTTSAERIAQRCARIANNIGFQRAMERFNEGRENVETRMRRRETRTENEAATTSGEEGEIGGATASTMAETISSATASDKVDMTNGTIAGSEEEMAGEATTNGMSEATNRVTASDIAETTSVTTESCMAEAVDEVMERAEMEAASEGEQHDESDQSGSGERRGEGNEQGSDEWRNGGDQQIEGEGQGGGNQGRGDQRAKFVHPEGARQGLFGTGVAPALPNTPLVNTI